jgi:hypothetical protein
VGAISPEYVVAGVAGLPGAVASGPVTVADAGAVVSGPVIAADAGAVVPWSAAGRGGETAVCSPDGPTTRAIHGDSEAGEPGAAGESGPLTESRERIA